MKLVSKIFLRSIYMLSIPKVNVNIKRKRKGFGADSPASNLSLHRDNFVIRH